MPWSSEILRYVCVWKTEAHVDFQQCWGPPVTVGEEINRSSTDSMSNAATIAVIVDVWAVSDVIELQLKLSDFNVLMSEFIL